jgi:hypothetical protein
MLGPFKGPDGLDLTTAKSTSIMARPESDLGGTR